MNRLPLVPPERSADFVGGGTGGQQLGTVHDGWQGELFRHALMLTGSQADSTVPDKELWTLRRGVDNCPRARLSNPRRRHRLV